MRWCECKSGVYPTLVNPVQDECFCSFCGKQIYYFDKWEEMENNWMDNLNVNVKNLDIEFNYLNEIHLIKNLKIKPQTLNVDNESWIQLRDRIVLNLTGEDKYLKILKNKDMRNYLED